jgi:DNA-directed RNA polymerase subunit N (RpoN/RPB10)
MKPIKCFSCGAKIRSLDDISIVFELCYKTFEKQPYAIVFHILCARCGTEIKTVEKEGKEAIELWRKLDQKISASAP